MIAGCSVALLSIVSFIIYRIRRNKKLADLDDKETNGADSSPNPRIEMANHKEVGDDILNV